MRPTRRPSGHARTLRCIIGLCAATAVTSCTAQHQPGDDAAMRIVVISDLNSSYGSTTYEPEVHRAVELIRSDWRPDLVLIAGDMIAGQRPALEDANVDAMWRAFDAVVTRPLRSAGIPIAFTMGNHDGSGHPGHERDRRAAAAYWLPRRAALGVQLLDSDSFPFRYTLAHDDVFIIVLDGSTGAVMADSAQVQWLRSSLASAPARAARVRLALAHVPLYGIAQGRNSPGEVQQQPDALRRLLEDGGVRLLITGHHHAYFPGRAGSLDLLYTGALGQSPRSLLGSEDPPWKSITMLQLSPDRRSLLERTWRISGDSIAPFDPRTLPAQVHGFNGAVQRR